MSAQRRAAHKSRSIVLCGADQEPSNWLTYSGNLNGQRYSLLTHITPQNAKNLQLEWVLQTRAPAEPTSKYEATALVVDGVFYTVQPPNVVIAADAVTGRVFWTYAYTPSPLARACCGRINRGLAILGHTLFMSTIDGNLVGVDARDGRLLVDDACWKAGPGILGNRGPARRQRQSDHGSGGRRVRHQRFHCRVRSRDWQANLEIQYGSPTRGTRSRLPGPATPGKLVVDPSGPPARTTRS